MESDDVIAIEVVAALRDRQALVSLSVPAGTTARRAVGLAALDSRVPGLDVSQCPLAIWGDPVSDQQVLEANDRVEVLRELVIDPRDARRRLATEGQVMGVPGPGED